jgi:hypothetical protein
MQASLALQQAVLQGKLGLLCGESCLHASTSIEPLAVALVRRWLSSQDNLSSNQPDVDRVLRYLGIQQRLVYKDDTGYQWKAVENAQPECELISVQSRDPLPETVGDLSWHWMDCASLKIQIDCSANSLLVVRQFDDGGWVAHSTDAAAPIKPLDNRLFVTLELAAGKQTIHLRRANLWETVHRRWISSSK